MAWQTPDVPFRSTRDVGVAAIAEILSAVAVLFTLVVDAPGAALVEDGTGKGMLRPDISKSQTDAVLLLANCRPKETSP